MGATDEVRNLEDVLSAGLQTLQASIAALRLPTITSISPLSVLVAGGDTVTITGNRFDETTSVLFTSLTGSTAATSFAVVSDTQITAVNPGHAAGPGGLLVSNAFGSGSDPAGTWGLVYGTFPLVTGMSPNNGVTGDTITVSGVGYTGATAVNFDSTPATSYVVVSDTVITAVVPTIGGGSQTPHIKVVTPAGTSNAHNSDKFIYNA